MTRCEKCGHDPDAPVVASWTFVLERQLLSLNARVSNVGASRWRYAKERDTWSWLVRAARLKNQISAASGLRRRLTLTRIYANGQRQIDRDNLAGGAKPLVDAIVREGLLRDDSPTWLELHHDQEPGASRAVRVLLEELAGDPEPAPAPRPRRKAGRR